MGMGTHAQFADTVELSLVKKICEEEYNKFMESLEEADIEFDDFAANTFCGNDDFEYMADEDKIHAIKESLENLKKKFKDETNLYLDIVWHEQGDIGDELDGGAFSVDGVYELTPAGKAFIDNIERKFWTTFG